MTPGWSARDMRWCAMDVRLACVRMAVELDTEAGVARIIGEGEGPVVDDKVEEDAEGPAGGVGGSVEEDVAEAKVE